LIEP